MTRILAPSERVCLPPTTWHHVTHIGDIMDENIPPTTDGSPTQQRPDEDYWHAYISEDEAAEFYDVTARTLQKWRQCGGGPRYFQFSSRCVRYQRIGLKDHADARARTSTSESVEEAAPR